MESTEIKNELLVYLLPKTMFENLNLRYCLGEIGVDKVVTFHNNEHIIQEMHNVPDMIIINAELHDPANPELIRNIRKINDRCQIVFLIEKEDHQQTVKLLRNGSFDFVLKNKEFTTKMTRIIGTVKLWKEMFED